MKKQKGFTRSISNELTISLFILVIMVEGVLLTYFYHRQTAYLLQELENKSETYTRDLIQVLAIPIWNLDTEQIRRIVSLFMQNDLVNEIRIKGADNGRILFSASKISSEENILKSADIFYKGQIVGYADIAFSSEFYKRELTWLRDTIFSILAGSLVLIFIIAGILLRVFIRNPLNILQKGIDRVAAGDYDYKFGEIRHTELSGIVKRFREMASAIEAREKSLHETNQELEREIEERKRAEDALRESGQKLRGIFNQTFQFMGVLALDGTVREINQTALIFAGVTESDVIGKFFWESPWWPRSERVKKHLAESVKAAARGEFVRYETVNISADQNRHCIDFSLKPVKDESKQVIMLIAEGRDINERKRIERELRESEQRLNAILSAIPDIVYQLDTDGNIIFINNAVSRYGYDPEELLGKSVLNFIHPDDRGKSEELIQSRESALGKRKHIEIRALAKHDASPGAEDQIKETEFYLSIASEPLYEMDESETKRFIGTQGIARDITDWIFSKKEKEKLEERLVHAQKMESLGVLAGGIAHDFNNILSAIFGYAQLAQMKITDNPPAPGQENLLSYIEGILEAGHRAKSLVQQILTFSRQSKSEKTPCDISVIMKEALKLLNASLPKSIEIRQSVKSGLGTVIADQTQVHQVLMNLCANAYHAMKEEGLLEVSLEPVEFSTDDVAIYPDLGPGRYLKLSVTDNGCGIDRKIIDRIFEPYFTTKDIGEGAGMGLAIVHGIVREHGGTIIVYSEPGMGTTFHVFFPIIEVEVNGETKPSESLPRGNERILFIDDEKPLAHIGRQILTELGYKVDTLTDPYKALELFNANPDRFDLIITDMTMPKMTGKRMAKEITKRRPDIPIIICTGFSSKMTRTEATEAGIRDFLMKPVTMKDFALAIRNALDGGEE